VSTNLAKVGVAVGKADYPHHFPEFLSILLALARVHHSCLPLDGHRGGGERGAVLLLLLVGGGGWWWWWWW